MRGIDWILLLQDRYQWRAIVKKARNIRVAYNIGNYPSSRF